MGKIISYNCDHCDFLTKNKNEIFIPSSIQNGEGDELLSSQEMFCQSCLVAYISNMCTPKIEKIEKKSSSILSKILKHKEEDEIIDEDAIADKETIIDEEIIDQEIEIEKDEELTETPDQKNRTYVKLQQVVTKEDEKMLLTHLGYKDLGEFVKITRLPTLIHSFVPLESGIDDLDINVCTEDAGGVMVDVQNGIPAIRLADFYRTESGDIYIHINELERVRQQLNGEI